MFTKIKIKPILLSIIFGASVLISSSLNFFTAHAQQNENDNIGYYLATEACAANTDVIVFNRGAHKKVTNEEIRNVLDFYENEDINRYDFAGDVYLSDIYNTNLRAALFFSDGTIVASFGRDVLVDEDANNNTYDSHVQTDENDEPITGEANRFPRDEVKLWKLNNSQDLNGGGKVVTADTCAEVPTEGPTDGDGEEAATSCRIDGIGWILCPVVNFLAKTTDASYWLLDNTLLRLEPIILPGGGEDSGMQLYAPWKVMRDFANVIFIIAFLIIVFSQLTSIGVSNYGIKKLLPKIVVAAILVNVSYFICALAVDLSNIIGNSMRGVLMPEGGTREMFTFDFTHEGQDFTGTGWEGLAGVVMGAASIVALVYVFLPVFLPLVVGAALAVATVVIALTLRQALVVMLVIISPLAFVALLLPNTEDYFKKWRSLFTAMLLVYPIISVVFGASALASNILMNSTDEFWVQMVGAGVSIIPLFITPIIMKVSGGVLNRWVGLINDPSKGWVDGQRNSLKEKGQLIKTGRAKRYGDFANDPTPGHTGVFGGAGSKRRRLLTFGTAYGSNNRERTRKDNLNEAESVLENTYLESTPGKEARNASKNAQDRLQVAQIYTDTVRLESPEAIELQKQTTAAETRKHIAEAEAQTAAILSIPHALEARAKEADLGKQIAENTSKIGALAGASTDLKIRATTSSENLSTAEGRDKQTFEEVAARGSSHPSLTALGVSGASANSAQASRFETKAVNNATANAGREGEIEYAKEINRAGSTLANRAGGRINPKGASNARANATAVEIKAFNDAVDTEKKTMSTIPTTSITGGPSGLEAIMSDASQSVERRTAATGMRANKGGMGEILEMFNNLGRDLEAAQIAGNTAEAAALGAMQQQFMDDVGSRLPASVTGPAKGAMSIGQFTGSLDSEILASLKEGRYSGEVLSGLHPKELSNIQRAISTKKATAGLTVDEASELAKLRTSIVEYKKAAPKLGRGLTSEREVPITAIEGI